MIITRKLISIICVLMFVLTAMPSMAASGGIEITSPAAGTAVELSSAANHTISISAASTGAERVLFYVDGEMTADIEGNNENIYTTDINIAKSGLGFKEIKAIAIYPNGDSYEDVVRINTSRKLKKQLNNKTLVTAVDFNDLPDSITATNALSGIDGKTDTASKDLASKQKLETMYGWRLANFANRSTEDYNVDAGIVRVPGKSGKTGDWALQICPYMTNQETTLEYINWSRPGNNDVFVLEFDFAVNGGVTTGWSSFQMGGFPSPDSVNRHTIFGSSKFNNFSSPSLATVVWYNMHYEYNVANNTCTLLVNGDKVWDNAVCKPAGDYTNLGALFFLANWTNTNYTSTYKNAWIAFDNIMMYIEGDALQAESLGYDEGNVSPNGNIPVGTESISITTNAEYDAISSANAELWINGAKAEAAEISNTGKIITALLPEAAKAESEIKLIVSDKATIDGVPTGVKLTAEYFTPDLIELIPEFKVNNSPISVLPAIGTGDVISVSADVTNHDTENKPIALYLTARSGDELVSITAVPVNTEAGKTTEDVILTLAAIKESDGSITSINLYATSGINDFRPIAEYIICE